MGLNSASAIAPQIDSTAPRLPERSTGKASKGCHYFIAISCTPRGQPPEVDQRVHSDGWEIAQEAGQGLRFRTRGRAGEYRPLDEIGHLLTQHRAQMSGFGTDQHAETTAVSVLHSTGDPGKARPTRGGGRMAKRIRRRDPGKMVGVWSSISQRARAARCRANRDRSADRKPTSNWRSVREN